MNFRFPAVFRKEDDAYHIIFPDLMGGYTCGFGMQNSIYMAKDLIRTLMIFNFDDARNSKPSTLEKIEKEYPGELVIMINERIADKYLK